MAVSIFFALGFARTSLGLALCLRFCPPLMQRCCRFHCFVYFNLQVVSVFSFVSCPLLVLFLQPLSAVTVILQT